MKKEHIIKYVKLLANLDISDIEGGEISIYEGYKAFKIVENLYEYLGSFDCIKYQDRSKNRNEEPSINNDEVFTHDETMPTFGELLEDYRKNIFNESIHSFAKRLKTDASCISKIVNNKRLITPRTAIKYAKLLNEPEEKFLNVLLNEKRLLKHVDNNIK